MKLCYAVAVAALVLALCSQGESQSAAGPDECCFRYYNKTIPAGKIRSYKTSHPSCPMRGVILITVANKRICANGDEKNVLKIIDRIDNLFGTQTTTSAP